MFSENAAKEMQREREYKTKFEKFNDKEARYREQYKNNVMTADQQKIFDQMQWVNKNTQDHNQWLAEKEKLERQMRA